MHTWQLSVFVSQQLAGASLVWWGTGTIRVSDLKPTEVQVLECLTEFGALQMRCSVNISHLYISQPRRSSQVTLVCRTHK